MRYKTDIHKGYWHLLINYFEADVLIFQDNNFDKRSSVTKRGGRPYLYSPREIGDQMVIYFRNCIEYNQPFMVTGLCLYLGISRRGLLNLQKSSRYEFVHIIQKGKQMIEGYLEYKAQIIPNPSMQIFILKRMGWK
jgi:hypothetical protein